MPDWEYEPFAAFLTDDHFEVTDAGQLHAPVRSFSLKRNDKLQIILETKCGEKAEINEILRPAGSIRTNLDAVELRSRFSPTTARLIGVQRLETHTTSSRARSELKDTSKVQRVKAELSRAQPATQTIDWLENARNDFYLWPDMVKDQTVTTKTRAFGRTAEALRLTSNDERSSSGRRALNLNVGGVELYLVAGTREDTRGYIFYVGTPDDDTRRKIRTVLSFTLGIYLVHLGHSTYAADSELASFEAISAYSIDGRAFDLHTLPPAPIGKRGDNDLDPVCASRIINAIYSAYDDLNFGALSWAYWHAMCAPIHIAAVHFGAAIEALQRRYAEKHLKDFETKLISRKSDWDAFAGPMTTHIDKLDITTDRKDLLKANIGLLNQMPRRIVTDTVFDHLNIAFGEEERRAWRQRNDAAHGNEMPPGSWTDTIRDTRILRVLFHRMVLRMTNATDRYADYASVGFPVRPLAEPTPGAGNPNATES